MGGGRTAVACQAASLLSAAEPPAVVTERLQRLELTAQLLPELLRVLDVRQIFGVLSPPATVPAAAPRNAVTVAAAASPPVAATSASDLPTMERAMVEYALKTARFNESKAAKALG